MDKLTIDNYQHLIKKAVEDFWQIRKNQSLGKKKVDQGSRSSVTGGKQLDGFLELFSQVSKDLGVPGEFIFTRGNHLPGFFRPSKDWDFLIIAPNKQLVAALEFKSQVGSFGNNFNNRTEEALGSAVDLWTAFKENGFPQVQPPWIGYLFLVENTLKSTRLVRNNEPHFKVRTEFQNTSYLDRYVIFCKKLMQERHYSATALISTNEEMSFSSPENEISIESFILSFMGFIQGKLNLFEK